MLRPIIDNILSGKPEKNYLLEEEPLKHTWQDHNSDEIYKATIVPSAFQWSLINTYHNALKRARWKKILHKIRQSY